ncbi:MAG: energy-coupling factor transporter ATPase [Coriobacteriia bacterium]|nr:energy-coupling factor transporter ATPase [Coriobacteriia bacterium]
MLEFSGVSYDYPGHGTDQPALTDMTCSIGQGEIVALLGANGSGKSTLVRLSNGILVPSAGTVRVDGIPTDDDELIWEVRSRVGVVFQNPDNQIVGTVVEEEVAFGPENLGVKRNELRSRVDEALAAVGLTGLERREPHLLSGGQKQRLAIAGALAMRPGYLVLDEPTSMLDPAGRSDVLGIIDRLRDSGTGILHVTHHLADTLGADRVLVLHKGRLVYEGLPDELLFGALDLTALGLRLPAAMRFAEELRRQGVTLTARARDASSIGEALWG